MSPYSHVPVSPRSDAAGYDSSGTTYQRGVRAFLLRWVLSRLPHMSGLLSSESGRSLVIVSPDALILSYSLFISFQHIHQPVVFVGFITVEIWGFPSISLSFFNF